MRSMSDFSNLMVTGVETAAQMSIGQAVLRLVDRVMWVIEKSVQWSLPTKETVDSSTKENGKVFGPVELVRPLPWIFFLPTLIFLRFFRFGLNLSASLLGYPEVQPADMIGVIQRGRRRLRAIKSSGLKSMRQKKYPVKDRTMTIKEASKNLAKTIRLTLSTLSCLDSGSKTSPSPPPTKIRVSNILDSTSDSPADENKKIVITERKRNYSEMSTEAASEDESDMETLLEKLNRLANESGSDDKDFSPNDVSSSSYTTEYSESETEMNVSMSEVHDLKAEKEEMEKTWCGNQEQPADKACDDELHKLLKNLDEYKNKQTLPNLTVEDAAIAVGVSLIEKQHGTTNGVSNDVDPAYFSPISWKSVSPDLSVSSDKTVLAGEGNGEDLGNGEVENGKEDKDDDSSKPSIETGGEVANGHAKEKQKSTSHSNKHHQKNKRGNHGNRKKK